MLGTASRVPGTRLQGKLRPGPRKSPPLSVRAGGLGRERAGDEHLRMTFDIVSVPSLTLAAQMLFALDRPASGTVMR